MWKQLGEQDESVAHPGRRGCNDPLIAHLVGCRSDLLTCRVGGTIMSLRLQLLDGQVCQGAVYGHP